MNKKIQKEYFIHSSKKEKNFIIPIFMPFFACPQICVFCNQSLQTGHKKNVEENFNIKESSLKNKKNNTFNNTFLDTLLNEAEKNIEIAKNTEKNIEIAFYGGTFSALPAEELEKCLNFIEFHKKQGNIQRARCSTRPDACSLEVLEKMYLKGINTIELGIQTFNNSSLLASNRGYTNDITIVACKNIKKVGFNLGIQLLPNLPAQKHEDFLSDIRQAIELKPDFMRFYPCLVVENTKLALIWKEGKHRVWTFEDTINLLAQALFMAWQANIPVIRIGIAPEKDFYKNVLAGVHHPALGQYVQEKALEYTFKEICKEHSIISPQDYLWEFPLNSKGFLMLKKNIFWKQQGISSKNIIWQEKSHSLKFLEKN